MSESTAPKAENPVVEPPHTVEGAYMLHQYFVVDWTSWHELSRGRRRALLDEAGDTLADLFRRKEADEAGGAYRVLGHKADLGLVHLRRTPEELLDVEHRVSRMGLHGYLQLRSSYLSIVELSVHGVQDRHGPLLRQKGIEPGTPEWDRALEETLQAEKERLHHRLYPELPETRYQCFYPMSKRRGEVYNWYTLTSRERGLMMRGHARVGRLYTDKVTQIISASTGLDDWEWGVDLFAEDALLFKKLVYEMRFDEASSRFAEFGPFVVGVRTEPRELIPD